MAQHDFPYRIVKAKGPNTATFVNVDSCQDLDAVRTRHGNLGLKISVPSYEAPDPSSRRTYPLCVHVTCSSLEQARRSTLEVVYYLAENCGVPAESVDLTYNGAGNVADDDAQTRYSGPNGARADEGAATPAEFVILVPPVVFGGTPTLCVPLLNYELARQMRDGGIANLDIDVYLRDHFVPLKDSIDSATGRFIVRASVRDLLYLSPKGILDLSQQPRGDDCAVVGRSGEAAEWFAEAISAVEKRQRQQLQLRQVILDRGWFIPFCIRQAEWRTAMAREQALEVCRVVGAWYSFISAGTEEVYEHVRRIGRRNDVGDSTRLRNIVAFSRENVVCPECTNPLLQRFCPRGRCLMTEILSELKNPRLFA